jgi:hypothetical protein
MPMAMENLSIAHHWDTLWYAHTWDGSYKPKVRQFDVSDFVSLQRQPNDPLDTFFSHIILRIKVIKPLGCWSYKELTDAQFEIILKIVRPATCRTWILPSSRRLRFFHLIIHVKYVKRQTMLIRCYFVITIMVDTISSTLSWSSLKFPSTIGTIHHVLLQHLDFYSDHAMLFRA